MHLKRYVLAIIIIFLVVFIPQVTKTYSEVYIGMANEKYALILNTSNNFTLENLNNFNLYPKQVLQAYFTLKNIGYSDSEITLMLYHPGNDFDLNKDGKNALDVAKIDYEDSAVTKENFKNEVNRLSLTASKDSEVLIYIVAHGAYRDSQVVFMFEDGTYVSGQELQVWLKPLRSSKFILLLDFCYSAEFLNSMYQFKGAYVWAAGAGKRAMFTPFGSAFFHPFWDKIADNCGIIDACEYAKTQITPEVEYPLAAMVAIAPFRSQDPGYIIQRDGASELTLATLEILSAISTTIGAMLSIILMVILVTTLRWQREIHIREKYSKYNLDTRVQTLSDYLAVFYEE